jgi:hypothetical protein
VKLLKIAALFFLVLANHANAAESQHLSADQSRVLEAARAAALKYAHQLPDFICTQTTRRSVVKSIRNFANEANVNPQPDPVSHDTIEEQLTYVGGKESYSVLTINRKKAKNANHLQFAGAMSSGEFGTMFTDVFDPDSKTTFTWEREMSHEGRPVWIFKYRVPKEAGTTLFDKKTNTAFVAPYSGRVIIDPENNNVLTISSSLEIPFNFPIQKVERRIDYAVQQIAGKDYCLPIHSELHMEQGVMVFDNQIDFRNYHHFSSESTIHFGAEAKQ